jgi:YesN/AraC family two-component response regulator
MIKAVFKNRLHTEDKAMCRIISADDRWALLVVVNVKAVAGFEYRKEVRDTMAYIEERFTGRLTLSEIAAAVSLNRSYLCRLFKRETGRSIFAYINELRMQKAVRMILGGDTHIAGVAYAAGFSDPFYFTRVFKKSFGVAPSEFREYLFCRDES